MPDNPTLDFNPADFTGIVRCGEFFASGGRTFLGLYLTVTGEGEAYVTLGAAEGRKEVQAFMGAAEWKAFAKAFHMLEHRIDQLKKAGRIDEMMPVCPG